MVFFKRKKAQTLVGRNRRVGPRQQKVSPMCMVVLLVVMTGVICVWRGNDAFKIMTTTATLSETFNSLSTSITITKKKKTKNRRRFVSYTSSAWEQLWLDHVQEWTDQEQICQVLFSKQQQEYMFDFLQLLCTAYLRPPHQDWCIMDDEYRPLFYNTQHRYNQSSSSTASYELFFHSESPFAEVKNISELLLPPQSSSSSSSSSSLLTTNQQHKPIIPGKEHEHLVSKFVFYDEQLEEEYVEYIEPLVSHLRFPLARCLNTTIWPIPYGLFRGYVIPPPLQQQNQRQRISKAVYFDAGASSWTAGGGGPSLKFFVNIWQRHGITFDSIYAYEMSTTSTDFYQDVPPEYVQRTLYRQCAVASSSATADQDHPFIPHEIEHFLQRHHDSNPDEDDYYVLFKLDIDSPTIEAGSIEYLLNLTMADSSDDDDNRRPPLLVHEIAWEHHVIGNYLMRPAWSGPAGFDQRSLKESYDLFLQLRQKGIRAHSWV